MLPNRHPADQLADIRNQIKALKAQEKRLRDEFAAGRLPCAGSIHEVEVRMSKRRVFLRDNLPQYILEDPQYWTTRSTKTVVMRKQKEVFSRTDQPVARDLGPPRAVRPGDPVAVVTPALQLESEDDFDVIERFDQRVA